ncbi:MAG: cupin domain-containing protein [Alicyclobacillus sp.]|nr:cupin domain-containing protein [Alicyclobacillus sp.]
MANRIKAVNLVEMAQQPGKRRRVLMNGPRFHTWLHIYQPGDSDEMHCHNADQTFTCISGECTMNLDNGETLVLKPGMVALIPGGSFYQLVNNGSENMILLGARAISDEASLKIDYETRKNINEGTKGTPPTGTRILV